MPERDLGLHQETEFDKLLSALVGSGTKIRVKLKWHKIKQGKIITDHSADRFPIYRQNLIKLL